MDTATKHAESQHNHHCFAHGHSHPNPQIPLPRVGIILTCRSLGHAVFSAIIRCQGWPRASTCSCRQMRARRRRPSSVHALPCHNSDTSFSTGVYALASLAFLVAMPLFLSVVSRQHPLPRTAGEYLHGNRITARKLGISSSGTRNRWGPASYSSCLPSF